MSEEIENSPAPRRGMGTAVKVGLVSAGLVAGVIGATAIGASATTSSTGSTSASSAAPAGGAYHVPGLSGVVSAVGSGSVTIKTSSATSTYTVTSASDIDKNGEAQLSDLVVGDAVTFNVMPNSSTTIDKLHAGDEAKDRPAAPPANGPGTTG